MITINLLLFVMVVYFVIGMWLADRYHSGAIASGKVDKMDWVIMNLLVIMWPVVLTVYGFLRALDRIINEILNR